MTYEAILRDVKPLVSRRFTCATATGIAKGTYLKGTDPSTASACTAEADFFVGFAHADVNKSTDTAFNTETSVTADKGGIYELTASGAITANAPVMVAAPGNQVMEAGAEVSFGVVIGIARETAVDAEQINVEVFP